MGGQNSPRINRTNISGRTRCAGQVGCVGLLKDFTMCSMSVRFAARCLAACLAALTVHSAAAREIVVRAPDEVRGALEAASLSLATDPEAETQDVLAAAQADYGRLVAALYETGRYGGQVSIKADGREVAGISPLSPPARVERILITVDPGPVFRLGRAEITPLAPETALPEGFRPGEPARSALLGSSVRTAVEAWRLAGHAKARATDQSVTARHEKAELDARFRIDPGPVVRFGPLTITGNEKVRTERIHAIAGLPEGATFSPEDLDRTTARLRRTGAFSSVSLTEDERLGPDNTLGITAEVAEAKPRRLGFGAELSSLEGLQLSGFWLHRNLRGGAEQLRFDGEISGIGGNSGGMDYSIDGRYTIPAALDPDTDLFVTGGLEHLGQPNFSSDNAEISLGLERRFSEQVTGETALGLRYSQARDATGEHEFLLLTLPTIATHDRRDNPLNPTSGTFLQADLTPFYGLNGADSGLRAQIDGRGYWGFGNVVLAGRLQFGTVVGSRLTETVPDFLFFSGGTGTVRGQDFQSLGVDIGADTLGGRSFVSASAEIRARIVGAFSVVGFFDTGLIGAGCIGCRQDPGRDRCKIPGFVRFQRHEWRFLVSRAACRLCDSRGSWR